MQEGLLTLKKGEKDHLCNLQRVKEYFKFQISSSLKRHLPPSLSELCENSLKIQVSIVLSKEAPQRSVFASPLVVCRSLTSLGTGAGHSEPPLKLSVLWISASHVLRDACTYTSVRKNWKLLYNQKPWKYAQILLPNYLLIWKGGEGGIWCSGLWALRVTFPQFQ